MGIYHALFKEKGHECRVASLLIFIWGATIGLIDAIIDSPGGPWQIEYFLWMFASYVFYALIRVELLFYRAKNSGALWEDTILLQIGFFMVDVGAFPGLLQLVFWFIFAVMRGMINWRDLNQTIWILPGITLSLLIYYIIIIGSLIIGVIGFYIIYKYCARFNRT
jgi:hypothetical protein